jgi:hypothetical protein
MIKYVLGTLPYWSMKTESKGEETQEKRKLLIPFVGFEVLTAAIIKRSVVYDTTSSSALTFRRNVYLS